MDIHIDYAGRVEKLGKAAASGGEMLTTTPLELTVLDA